MTLTEPAAPATTRRAPRYGVLIGLVYLVCVVLMSVSITAEILFGYVGTGPQPRSLVEQLGGVVGFGTGGLVVSLLAARFLGADPARSRIGAIVLAVLAVPAIAFFWCGLPAMLGATAAYLAGVTAGRTPHSGAPRVFGTVGLVLAVLNPVVNFLALSISWLSDLA
jgi:hypothetical protein